MDVIDYHEMGRRIAKRRKELHYTQATVSEKVGIGEKFLSEIENARSVPSLETLMSICEVISITPNDLLLKESPETNDLDKAALNHKYDCLKDSKLKKDLLFLYLEMLEKYNFPEA